MKFFKSSMPVIALCLAQFSYLASAQAKTEYSTTGWTVQDRIYIFQFGEPLSDLVLNSATPVPAEELERVTVLKKSKRFDGFGFLIDNLFLPGKPPSRSGGVDYTSEQFIAFVDRLFAKPSCVAAMEVYQQGKAALEKKRDLIAPVEFRAQLASAKAQTTEACR